MQSEIPSGIVAKRIGIFESITPTATQFSRRMPVTQFSRRMQSADPAQLCVPTIPCRAPLDIVHACITHACVPRATVDVLQPRYKLAPRKRVLRLAVRCTPVTRFA